MTYATSATYDLQQHEIPQPSGRDCGLSPVIMKKNRPGVVVSVMCHPQNTTRLRTLLFAETTTLGIRTQRVARSHLPRVNETVETPYGAVRIKVARWG